MPFHSFFHPPPELGQRRCSLLTSQQLAPALSGCIKLKLLIRNCSSKNLNMCISPSLLSLVFRHMLNFSTHLQIFVQSQSLILLVGSLKYFLAPYPVSVIFNRCLSIIATSTHIPPWKAFCRRLRPDIRSWKNPICLWARVLSCFLSKLECQKVTEYFSHWGEFLMHFHPNFQHYNTVMCCYLFCFTSPLSKSQNDWGWKGLLEVIWSNLPAT